MCYDVVDELILSTQSEAIMINYNVLYHIMFNAATDALRLLEQGKTADAMIILASAQQHCEELYIESEQ